MHEASELDQAQVEQQPAGPPCDGDGDEGLCLTEGEASRVGDHIAEHLKLENAGRDRDMAVSQGRAHGDGEQADELHSKLEPVQIRERPVATAVGQGSIKTEELLEQSAGLDEGVVNESCGVTGGMCVGGFDGCAHGAGKRTTGNASPMAVGARSERGFTNSGAGMPRFDPRRVAGVMGVMRACGSACGKLLAFGWPSGWF